MRGLRQDVRLALRRHGRTPGFTATVALTLALGIGLATAVLTIADALLLRPLPMADQGRLVVLASTPAEGGGHRPLSLESARGFTAGTPTLAGSAVLNYEGAAPVTVREGGRITRFRRSLVSGDFFAVLGADPLLGRALRPEDDAAGAVPVVVLSHRGWQARFGGDSDVVGRRITTHEDGVTATIVGVMPPGVDYPRGVDAWIPMRVVVPPAFLDYLAFDLVARLAPAATPERAREALTAYFQREGASAVERGLRGRVEPLRELILGNARPAVLAFAAAAALLLLITCLNVANLLLVRGLARARDVAVRRALGASRGRVVAELLTEHALLAAVGGLLGIVVATLAVQAFVALAPEGLPRLEEIGVNGAVLVGALGLTAAVTLLSAVAPAVWVSQSDARLAMGTAGAVAAGAGGRQTGGRRTQIVREMLVGAQVALALLVLSAAGLVGRSLWKLERVDLAFDPARLVVAELALPAGRYDRPEAQAALYDRVLPALERVPGVQGASPVVSLPYAEQVGWRGRPMREGQSEREAAGNPWLDVEVVAPSFFRTLGLPVLQGRALTDADRADAPPAIVLSASAARQYWPHANPVGQRLVLGPPDARRLATVVGVVPDPRYRDLREGRPTMYVPVRQSFFPFAPPTLLLRTSRTPSDAAAAVRVALAEVAPDVVLARAEPFGTLLAGPLAQPRMNVVLIAVFAAAALGLSAVGLFGVLATTVRQRTRELGIRMALGATAADVARLVVGRGLIVAGAGIAVGLLGALAANRLLAALLYGVSPLEAWTLGGVAALVLGVAGLAAIVPARASTRIAPATALRAE